MSQHPTPEGASSPIAKKVSKRRSSGVNVTGLYRRGQVWWWNRQDDGHRVRLSLETTDHATAGRTSRNTSASSRPTTRRQAKAPRSMRSKWNFSFISAGVPGQTRRHHGHRMHGGPTQVQGGSGRTGGSMKRLILKPAERRGTANRHTPSCSPTRRKMAPGFSITTCKWGFRTPSPNFSA